MMGRPKLGIRTPDRTLRRRMLIELKTGTSLKTIFIIAMSGRDVNSILNIKFVGHALSFKSPAPNVRGTASCQSALKFCLHFFNFMMFLIIKSARPFFLVYFYDGIRFFTAAFKERDTPGFKYRPRRHPPFNARYVRPRRKRSLALVSFALYDRFKSVIFT